MGKPLQRGPDASGLLGGQQSGEGIPLRGTFVFGTERGDPLPNPQRVDDDVAGNPAPNPPRLSGSRSRPSRTACTTRARLSWATSSAASGSRNALSAMIRIPDLRRVSSAEVGSNGSLSYQACLLGSECQARTQNVASAPGAGKPVPEGGAGSMTQPTGGGARLT